MTDLQRQLLNGDELRNVPGIAKSDLVGLQTLDASHVNVTLSTNPKRVPEPGSEEERSQKVCSDHMI